MPIRVSILPLTLVDNTIRIDQWVREMKQDRCLLDCLEIVEQLHSNEAADVTKDLQYIIDMKAQYKTE